MKDRDQYEDTSITQMNMERKKILHKRLAYIKKKINYSVESSSS